jgi:DNA polymerase III alpha subunit
MVLEPHKEESMKQWNSFLMGVPVLLALVATTAVAQGGYGGRKYDPKSEVTVKGTVQDVQQQTGKNGWSGTHLTLNTDAGTFDVHVGPTSYIAQKQFSFAKGDKIEVVGSKVTISDKEALLAREITKDGKTLVLRNAQGVPEWSGGRRP